MERLQHSFLPVAATLLALVVTLLATPVVIRLAWKVGATDRPGQRKIHDRVVPRLGGLALAAGITSAWALTYVLLDPAPPSLQRVAPAFIVGSLCVIAIGIVDDIRGLGALPKVTFHVIAAVIAWRSGISFETVTLPFADEPLQLGWLSMPATLLWILLVTNAWNLIDGMDGLAATLGVIAAAIFAMMLIVRAHDAALLVVAPLIGSLLGFLPYNIHPARVFLGDTGSYLIGYQLALVSIMTGQKGIASFAIFGPVAILGLPILDVGLAVARRLLRPGAPSFKARLHGVFQADRGHLHHRALDRGWSQNKALVILSTMSAILGLFGLFTTFSITPRFGGILLVVTVLLTLQLYSEPTREIIRSVRPPPEEPDLDPTRTEDPPS